MDNPVSLEIYPPLKTSAANAANERLLSRVDDRVLLEIHFLVKRFTTNVAAELFLFRSGRSRPRLADRSLLS